jgi:hypothetical protein
MLGLRGGACLCQLQPSQVELAKAIEQRKTIADLVETIIAQVFRTVKLP